jgi:serine/threonine-protein kinase HipA
MLTAAAILEADWRNAAVDYHELMKLTKILSRSNDSELIQMYRRMCFNVFAHNRDDHSKNFTFLYKEDEQRWVLSPAYDLTFSYSIGGEHATTVNGNGVNPGMADLLAVAKEIGIQESKAKVIALQVQECVEERLRKYMR